MTSSEDLHPSHGGRFVLRRQPQGSYSVEVFLPDDKRLESTLRWGTDNLPRLTPPLDDPWAQDETLKLARVLRRSQSSVLRRWRGR